MLVKHMQAASTEMTAATELCSFYRRVRAFTEHLCEPLEIEDYIPQLCVDVSPAKWNIAHVTWFFEEMILKHHLPGYNVFDPRFGFLFNSYYNSIGERTQRDHRGDLSRPTVKEVFAYRKYVDEHMLRLLSEPPAAVAGGSDLADLVTLGLNHEQQHQELLITDLKYTFAQNPLFPAYREGYAPEEDSASGTGELIEIQAGTYEIGYAGDSFCFDNELARHRVFIHDFAIWDRPVTNAEFLEFIEAGGYSDHRLWHSEGWDWVNSGGVTSPLYWHLIEGEWMEFTLGGLRPVVPDAPVCHVSYYEAAAYAEWRGMRLPTEFEWETASSRFDWGKRWEWTNSAYLPYPGFKKAAGAVGEYNGKFMINQMVLRGASVATPEGHSRPTYRNFFQPHLRWQFTGIRLATDKRGGISHVPAVG
jgi:ergothioneine biosynthesis protein EgtB